MIDGFQEPVKELAVSVVRFPTSCQTGDGRDLWAWTDPDPLSEAPDSTFRRYFYDDFTEDDGDPA